MLELRMLNAGLELSERLFRAHETAPPLRATVVHELGEDWRAVFATEQRNQDARWRF